MNDTDGMTRKAVVGAMPSEIHPQTYATYEYGVRQRTLGRFVEICVALGVSAPDLLSWALQDAGIDVSTIGIHVDLIAIAEDRHERLLPPRRWSLAYSTKTQKPTSRTCLGRSWATWPPVPYPQADFVLDLLTFTPRPSPVRR